MLDGIRDDVLAGVYHPPYFEKAKIQLQPAYGGSQSVGMDEQYLSCNARVAIVTGAPTSTRYHSGEEPV